MVKRRLYYYEWRINTVTQLSMAYAPEVLRGPGPVPARPRELQQRGGDLERAGGLSRRLAPRAARRLHDGVRGQDHLKGVRGILHIQ